LLERLLERLLRHPFASSLLILFALPLLLSLLQSPFSAFVERDNFYYNYPAKQIFIQQLKQGVIPYWNPYASFGQPMLADPTVLPFYPDNLLYFVLPFDCAWNFHFWFHWILGVFGVFLLLRELGRSNSVALLGSIWWGGSGFLLSLFCFANLLATVSLIPIIVYSLRRLLAIGRIYHAIGFGALVGFQILAGEPVSTFAGLLVCALLLIEWRKLFNTRKLLLLLASMIVCGIVVAPQIISLMEVYSWTTRAMLQHSFIGATNASIEPQRFIELFIPYCWGIPYAKAPGLFAGMQFTNFPFLIYSIHFSLLLLFGFLISLRRARPLILSGIILLTVLALGRYTPIYKVLFQLLPALSNIRYPIKFLSGAIFLLVLYSSEAIEQWLKPGNSRRAIWIFTALWIVAAAYYLLTCKMLNTFFVQQVCIAAALLAAAVAVLYRFQNAIVVFAIVEAVIGARFLWLGIPKESLHPPEFHIPQARLVPALAGNEKHHPKNMRELYDFQSSAAYPFFGAMYGVGYALESSPSGLYSFYSEYLGGFVQSLPLQQKWNVYSKLGIGAIVTSQDVNMPGWTREQHQDYWIYRTMNVAAEITPAKNFSGVANPEKSLKGLASNDETYVRRPTKENHFTQPSSFIYTKRNPGFIEMKLQSSGPVFLTTRITYFPTWKATGWISSGNKLDLPVNQTDLAFVGLEVPANVQRIELRYTSYVNQFTLGIWMFAMILLGSFFIYEKCSNPSKM
jgi:hypothetical protein